MTADQYVHLLGKPVEGVVKEEERRTRGILVLRSHLVTEDEHEDYPMVRLFGWSGSSYWTSWDSLEEIPFEELSSEELLSWHEVDPKGYLRAAFRWFFKECLPS